MLSNEPKIYTSQYQGSLTRARFRREFNRTAGCRQRPRCRATRQLQLSGPALRCPRRRVEVTAGRTPRSTAIPCPRVGTVRQAKRSGGSFFTRWGDPVNGSEAVPHAVTLREAAPPGLIGAPVMETNPLLYRGVSFLKRCRSFFFWRRHYGQNPSLLNVILQVIEDAAFLSYSVNFPAETGWLNNGENRLSFNSGTGPWTKSKSSTTDNRCGWTVGKISFTVLPNVVAVPGTDSQGCAVSPGEYKRQLWMMLFLVRRCLRHQAYFFYTNKDPYDWIMWEVFSWLDRLWISQQGWICPSQPNTYTQRKWDQAFCQLNNQTVKHQTVSNSEAKQYQGWESQWLLIHIQKCVK